MTSSHHGPYVQGYTRATMVVTERSYTVKRSETQKSNRSSDWSLKPDSMKLESLVLHEVGIASNRASARRGEYVPGPCTHRPSHHPSRGYPKPAV